jgi:hypothetical protein
MKVEKKKQNPSWLPSGSYDKDSGNLDFFLKFEIWRLWAIFSHEKYFA